MEYEQNFYVSFRFIGELKICGGEVEKEYMEEYEEMFEELIKFTSLLKTTSEYVRKMVPCDFRIGKIKGKYIVENVMFKKEKSKLKKLYESHLQKNLKIAEISLNEYINAAAICYRAAYKEAEKLMPLEMYKGWVDGRHRGMLDIENADNKEEFKRLKIL